MKKLKKVFAVLLSVAMILGMSSTVFADQTATQYPTKNDKDMVTVGGLTAGDKVSFYQIVEPEYKGDSFKNYKVVSPYVIADVTSPTADEITTIAGQITADTTKAAGPVTAQEATITQELKIGTYLVLVEAASTDTVYNPMIVSVYYTVDGVVAGSVSAGQTFDIDEKNAYAKSTNVDLEKTIVGSNGKLEDGTTTSNKGDDTAIGDDIDFRIVAQVPSYSKEYLENNNVITYKISDQLVKGLDSYKDITVKIGSVEGDTVTATNVPSDKYSIEPTPDENGTLGDSKNFVITFNGEYIQSLNTIAASARNIIVEYTAKLSEDAGINFDPNENKATLEYTHKPGTGDNTAKKEDKTYHYTFGIDANLSGENQYITGEIFKTEGGDMQVIETGPIKISNPLAGAKFALYKADNDFVKGEQVGSTDSAEDGRLAFTGLDAGKYVLQETEAPEGYSLNDREIPVEITAVYNPDGTLKSYSIQVDKKNTSTYEATYDGGLTIKKTEVPTDIQNTKLGALPSTGGIGTIIFTVGGCLIMVVAAALYFANRRKAANSESK
ncbi:MAG: isopeptide-forming domain-containing fimbrial protein [Firmicutes bacterium]|nr:isopeptide-forming domain-containing fimbrial protein [Bacillota bacterium]